MIKRNEIQFYVLKDGLDMYMPKPASRAPPLSLLANETGDGIKQTRKGTAAFVGAFMVASTARPSGQGSQLQRRLTSVFKTWMH